MSVAILLVLAACTLLPSRGVCAAAQPAPVTEPTPPPPPEKRREILREIRVPFEDLHLLLGTGTDRVLLPREEFEALRAQARQEDEQKPPRAVAPGETEYSIRVTADRATIEGSMSFAVLEEGVFAVPLDLAHVGLRAARLDGESAPLGRADDGRLVLFLRGVGPHALDLEAVTPLETTAARQILHLRLPMPGAARVQLTAPGDVEVRSGAAVRSRVYDEAEDVTRFELLAARGDLSLVLTLNSKLRRRERVVVARSVIVDEVTEAYENLHATVSFVILHRAVDRFEFEVPDGFEITSTEAPEVAHWEVRAEGGRRILSVRLRDETTEPVVLSISGSRTAPALASWTFPQLQPIDVAGHVAVLGLLAEDRLTVQDIAERDLIPVDRAVLMQALPRTVVDPEAGDARLRPVVAYYAPQRDFALDASFVRRPARRHATSHVRLIAADDGLSAQGGFTVQAFEDPLFALEFTMPDDWELVAVTNGEGQPLRREQHPDQGARRRVHVRLEEEVVAGNSATVLFRARRVPPGWLEDWGQSEIEFPRFHCLDTDRDVGAVTVEARDDLEVRPLTIEQLTPLDASEQAGFGVAGTSGGLAYRYEAHPYRATLRVQRLSSRLTAESFSFHKISGEVLETRHEVIYEVDQARVRAVRFTLPSTTPALVTVYGLNGVEVKERFSEDGDQGRLWTVRLADAHAGTVHLGIHYTEQLSLEDSSERQMPAIRAEDVAYQAGLVALEGNAELDIRVTDHPRRVDAGELADAAYQPGRRLLGVYSFVGDPSPVRVSIARHPLARLPSAIVQRAEVASAASTRGISQSSARFQLRTRAPFLQVVLPEGSTLWSVMLNGRPLLPQQDQDRILLSLPSTDPGAVQDLVVVYESPMDTIGFSGTITAEAPKLFEVDREAGTSDEVPVGALRWHLLTPEGYRIRSTGGTVRPEQDDLPVPAAVNVAGILYRLAGGIGTDRGLVGFFLSPLAKAREKAVVRSTWISKEDYVMAEGEGGARAEDPTGLVVGDRPDGRQPAAGPVTLLGVPDRAESSPVPREPADAAPTTQPAAGERRGGRARAVWALEGVRSLGIELDLLGGRSDYYSLGESPALRVRVINRRRQDALIAAVALAVVVGGLARTRRRWQAKVGYVAAVLFVSTLLAAFPGLLGWAPLLNAAFYAACLLIPYYLVAQVAMVAARIGRRLAGRFLPRGAVTLMLVGFALAAAPGVARANGTDEDPPPLPVPDNALLIPYHLANGGWSEPDRVLVPYEEFKDLWNKAHPERQLDPPKLPAPFALAGARYVGTLANDDVLVLRGRIDVDVFAAGPQTLRFPFAGAVLASATVDGGPARLQIAVEPPAQAPQEAAQQQAAPADAARSVALLHVDGEGRHRLELEVRVPLDRQGGWRSAVAELPTGEACALAITAPQAGTEVVLRGARDQSRFQVDTAGETIRTVIGDNGRLDLRWRPEVGQGQEDTALTADSSAVFDVQEDHLRLSWRTRVAFRRGERDFFELDLPSGFWVARVEGANVRGWAQEEAADGGRVLAVQLLKPATESEEFAVHLQADGIGLGEETCPVSVPAVSLRGAVRQTGSLVIRRSPLLDLRLRDASGLQRVNLSDERIQSAQETGLPLSPLGSRAVQAYTFAGLPYGLSFDARRVDAAVEASVQTILRISRRETRLESRVDLTVRDRPIYRVDVEVPADLEVETVSVPGVFEWDVADADGSRLLTVRFGAGVTGKVPVVFSGRFEGSGRDEAAVPHVRVLDVAQQRGEIAVQTDPAFDVRATDLVGLERVLLNRVLAWLQPAQRPLTRIALAYRDAEFSGTVQLVPRKSRVNAYTVSNVRVTDTSVEQTVLIDFTVLEAGVRSVQFELPLELAEARISVPHLRQKTVVTDEGRGIAVVTLELQDAVMNQLRVLVEHDRVLDPGEQTVHLPRVLTGRTDARYLAVESAGRDEVELTTTEGLDPLDRQRKEWSRVAALLKGGNTQAFLARADSETPALRFRTRQRATVETAGARIGLARTTLVVDSHGAFRAEQVLHVDNQTEQFLEIELPSGATLWTARVAGEYVKPVQPDAAQRETVRVPLIKTAAGELDYRVVLKYGGALPPLRRVSRVKFPVVRVVNIGVERSQVELFAPRTHSWRHFGGTMRARTQSGDLETERLAYGNEMLERLTSTLRHGSVFEKARASRNLASFNTLQEQITEDYAGLYGRNAEMGKEVTQARKLVAEAQRELEEIPVEAAAAAPDNRGNFVVSFEGQYNYFAENQVQRVDSNWTDAAVDEREDSVGFSNVLGNPDWFAANGLVVLDTDQQGVDRVAEPKYAVRADGPASGVQIDQALTLNRQIMEVNESTRLLGTDKSEVNAQLRGKSRRSQAELAERYRQKLEDADFARAATETELAAVYAPQDGVDESGRSADGDVALLGNMPVGGVLFAGGARGYAVGGDLEAVQAPTGLVSLDYDLPDTDERHWQRFQFSTPRGDVQLVGWAVSHGALAGLKRVGIVVAAAVALWVLLRALAGATLEPMAKVRIAHVLIVLGAIGLLIGFFPIAALAALVIAFVMRSRARRAMHPAVA